MAAYIQVVLREQLKNVGKSGEVVRVRPGFARNFLVPRQLAVYATEKNVSRLEHEKREAVSRAAKLRQEADAVSAKLNGVTITIRRTVGGDERMYGSVTAKDVAEALAAVGHIVDRRKIHMTAAIKTLGTHELTAKLGPEVSATFKLEVVKAEA
jgi:large subunit ribosomal protein L9